MKYGKDGRHPEWAADRVNLRGLMGCAEAGQ